MAKYSLKFVTLSFIFVFASIQVNSFLHLSSHDHDHVNHAEHQEGHQHISLKDEHKEKDEHNDNECEFCSFANNFSASFNFTVSEILNLKLNYFESLPFENQLYSTNLKKANFSRGPPALA